MATKFQKFDKGNQIETFLPTERELVTGDRFYWSCGQYGGIAEVVSVGLGGRDVPVLHTIRKVS